MSSVWPWRSWRLCFLWWTTKPQVHAFSKINSRYLLCVFVLSLASSLFSPLQSNPDSLTSCYNWSVLHWSCQKGDLVFVAEWWSPLLHLNMKSQVSHWTAAPWATMQMDNNSKQTAKDKEVKCFSVKMTWCQLKKNAEDKTKGGTGFSWIHISVD